MEAHEESVSRISSQVRSFHQRHVPFRLYHGSTNSTKHRKHDPSRQVDTSNLNRIISVDKKAKTCLVEPNVPMDQLFDGLQPHGLVPLVVMEFPGITVGGGFSGTAGESSGFKYGFFEDTIDQIEMVLATGEVVQASAEEREDLFEGAKGTFGTLGVITLLRVQCMESKRFVELTYHPTTDVARALSTMRQATESPANDYVDGILLAPNRGVIVTGQLTDTPTTAVQRFSRAQDPWFYIHAERSSQHTTSPVTVTTPLRDYLFRYDRGAFWVGKYSFHYFLMPFNRITRFLLDYFMHTRVMYRALHASGHSRGVVIQDLLIPSANVELFVEHVEAEFGFYPLWLCPFTVRRALPLRPRHLAQLGRQGGKKGERFVNVGVWGPGSEDYSRLIAGQRGLERKVRELGGVKWLYAQSFYTEEEFDGIYDRSWYERLREKYEATHLPTIYEKVRTDLSDVDTDVSRKAAGAASWSSWIFVNVWPISGSTVCCGLCFDGERDIKHSRHNPCML